MPRRRRSSLRVDQEHPQLDLAPLFTNKGLFSDNFFKNHLSLDPTWHDDENCTRVLNDIQNIYEQRRTFANEDQTQKHFIEPILDLLWREDRSGDCYEVEVTIPNLDARS